MEKIVYFFFLGAICLSVCGIVTMAVSPDSQNATPVNDSLKEVKNETPIEEPEVIETPVQEEELSPSEQIAIREGEKAEEAAISEEEPEQIEETDLSHVETRDENVIDKPIDEQNKLNDGAENKPVSTVETKKDITVRKTVNENGYVYVGKAYSGQTVEIKIKN